ncbi:MAG: histidinol dehydrogenase [Planctomycetota bacterium]|jgi:histidinol dehydrogenase
MLAIHNVEDDSPVLNTILNRASSTDTDVWSSVAEIVGAVRARGDEAVLEYTKTFDKVELTAADLKVTPEEFFAAEKEVEESFLLALTQARTNIRRFHEYQKRKGYVHDDGEGVILSKRVVPIETVGLYVPGGTAPLFSTVLMNVIPAQLAGVDRIIIATPPREDGTVDPHILATARLLGVNEVIKAGSAWAIAALAYGTESIPRVDKIVGPGNQYVSTAKKMVFGTVGIDAVAGPSEVVIIADEEANAKYIAADLLSQVEHGSGYESGVVITDSSALAEAVQKEVDAQLKGLSRSEAIEKSLEKFGAIFVVETLEQACGLADRIAPEHLEVHTRDPQLLSENIRNAGAIFLGPWSSEPVGDYFCGTNHVLPTGGAARFQSSLSVYDFLKDISIIRYSDRRLKKVGKHIVAMAELEGLTAHANAIQVRLEDLSSSQ